jgi:hypothetical protein
MTMKGRKQKVYPQEEIDKIIFQYTQIYKNNGLLKYMDIYRFAMELYNHEKIPFKLSEDFWRKVGRQGRESIDRANEVYEHSIILSDEEDEKIIDSTDAINKFFEGKNSNKEKLIGAVKINETKLKKYIYKNKKITNELSKKNLIISELKKEKALLEGKNKEYENLFFEWLDSSSNQNIPIVNLITTGKSRNRIVQKLFDTMFEDNPLLGFEEFDNYRTKKRNDYDTPNKVVPINEIKKKNSIIDDLDL